MNNFWRLRTIQQISAPGAPIHIQFSLERANLLELLESLIALGGDAEEDPARVILLLLILDTFQHFLDVLFEVRLVFGILHPPPIVLSVQLKVFLGAVTVRTDDVPALELKECTLRVVIEHLLIDIVPLLQLNHLDDIKVAGQFLFTAPEHTVLPLCQLLLALAAAACSLPLSAAAKETCDFAQTVHQPVSALVYKALTVEYDLVEEIELLALGLLADVVALYILLDKVLHLVRGQRQIVLEVALKALDS